MTLEGRFPLSELHFVLFEPGVGCLQLGPASIGDDFVGAWINFCAELARLRNGGPG